jgi:hypothetical protein
VKEVRFATDSTLEEEGFEPSVPDKKDAVDLVFAERARRGSTTPQT